MSIMSQPASAVDFIGMIKASHCSPPIDNVLRRRQTSLSSRREVVAFLSESIEPEAATEAIIEWIESKEAKGRTEEEIIYKLEAMEHKLLAMLIIHPPFRQARRRKGLPKSSILPDDTTLGTPTSSAPTASVCSSPPSDQSSPAAKRPCTIRRALLSKPRPKTSGGRPIPQAIPSSITVPPRSDSRMATTRPRPRSICVVSSPISEGIVVEQQEVSSAEQRPESPVDDPPTYYSGPNSPTSPSSSRPMRSPTVAFVASSVDVSSSMSSATLSSTTLADPEPSQIVRPTTSASFYRPSSALKRSMSVSSVPSPNRYRQSVAMQPDGELVDSLFTKYSPETFLRLFKA